MRHNLIGLRQTHERQPNETLLAMETDTRSARKQRKANKRRADPPFPPWLLKAQAAVRSL